MKCIPLHYVTMTNYDDSFRDVHVVYDKDNLIQTLGEVVSAAGATQIRIAETEKYPHVTFFFSGGRESEFTGERRIMIPSPKVATYDLQPEMSAHGIADAICEAMMTNPADFICLNFANPDMVGHTGIMSAAIKAVDTIDVCLGRLITALDKAGGVMLLTADHGNIEMMVDPASAEPYTAHTTLDVPVIAYGVDGTLTNGRLADVAPTLLDMMGLSQPAAMSGHSLLVKGA